MPIELPGRPAASRRVDDARRARLLVLVWFAACGALLAVACGGEGRPRAPLRPPTISASGTSIVDFVDGEGEPVGDGDWFAVHYDCRIAKVGDGPGEPLPYDSTRGGEPFVARLGGDSPLLPGFADGVRGMRRGGERRIVVPPAAAHGALGRGRVPPEATLEYDLHLVARFERTASGLQYRVVEPGRGEPPRAGDLVTIEQRAFLVENGRAISDSKQRGGPQSFRLGDGLAVPGLEEALLAMAPRARWQLGLAPAQAYGTLGNGFDVLPGQHLLLEVELVRVKR